MSAETASLVLKVESHGVTSANKELNTFSGTAARAEGAALRLTRTMLGLAGVYGVAQTFTKIATTIADFEQKMAGVRAVVGGTEEEMAQLTKTARELGATTQFSASEAAEGIRLLGQAGYDANQITAAMPGLLNLAIAGELGLSEAVDIAAASLAGFRLSANQSMRVADVLAMAANKTNTSVVQLGDGMKYVAPIAASLGISIEDTSAVLGLLSNAGLQGSMAGTGLRQVLSSLAGPSNEARKALESYGLTVKEVNPASNDLAGVIQKLASVGLTATDALTIFGDRGAPAILALTSQAGGIDALRNSLQEASGESERIAGVMKNTLRGQMKELQSVTEELMLKIGDAGLGKRLREAANGATAFAKSISDMVESGEAAAWVDLWAGKLELLTSDFKAAFVRISGIIEEEAQKWGGSLGDVLFDLPENLHATMGLLGAEFARGLGTMEVLSKNKKALIWGFLSEPGTDKLSLTNFFHGLVNPLEAFTNSVVSATQYSSTLADELKNVNEAADAEQDAVLADREARIKANAERLKEIDLMREQQRVKNALNEFFAPIDRASGKSSKPVATPSQPTLVSTGAEQLAALQDYLKSQQDLVNESFEKLYEAEAYANGKRLADAEKFYNATNAARQKKLADGLITEEQYHKLGLEAWKRYATEVQAIQAQDDEAINRLNDARLVATYAAADKEIEIAKAVHEANYWANEDALARKLISEEEYQAKSKANWEAYQTSLGSLGAKGLATIKAQNLAMYSSLLSTASDISAGLQSLVDENSGAAKTMFAISKAVAIAQAIVSTELAAAQVAADATIPFFGAKVAAVTAIRAMGYASVGIIAAQAVQGFATGGIVPGTSYTGDNVPARVNSGEMILNASQQRQLWEAANGGGSRAGGGGTNVNIINQAGVSITQEQRTNDDGSVDVNIVLAAMEDRLAKNLRAGKGSFSKSLAGTFPGLRRGAA